MQTVKMYRMQTGLSQKDFAKYIGVSTRSVQNWEQGISNPSVPVMEIIKIKCNLENLRMMQLKKADHNNSFIKEE